VRLALAPRRHSVRGGDITNCFGDSNHLAAIDGKPVLVAGDRRRAKAAPFTGGRHCLPFYRLHGLQCAGDYPDFCARFRLSCFTNTCDRLGMLSTIRSGWGLRATAINRSERLLMWVPMVCDLRGGILARWRAGIGHLNQSNQMPNEQSTNRPSTRYRRVGSGCPTRRCHIHTYFPLAWHGRGVSLLGINHHVGGLARCVVLLSQHSLVGSPNFVMNTSLTESSTASLLPKLQRISASGVSLKSFFYPLIVFAARSWSTIVGFIVRALFSEAQRTG